MQFTFTTALLNFTKVYSVLITLDKPFFRVASCMCLNNDIMLLKMSVVLSVEQT